ncbi:MAG: mechanosensitive ion channel protein MscS [Frankiales bacterium]|nr:mechanosensitive ion channel protein MscS [Frankiales bacterium]
MESWLDNAYVLMAFAALLGGLASVLIDWVIRAVAKRHRRPFLDRVHRALFRPFAATLIGAAALIAVGRARLGDSTHDAIWHIALIVTVIASAWLVVKTLFFIEEEALSKLPLDVENNRNTRRRRTQINILRRITGAAVTVVAIGVVLMSFDELRGLGASLLASAGVAGIVVGLAAQATLGNWIAGVQLAFTDALRLDDVIVTAGEWGRVEELTLTHVVLHLWDERRLVLPTSYFTTTPFENWTHNEARVLGAVAMHVDFGTPMDEVRAETRRILERSELWDGVAWVVQVVDTSETNMIIRVLASSPDAQSSWDLRCEIREGLLTWLEAEHPESLPRTRVLAVPPDDDDPFGPLPPPSAGATAHPGQT